MGKMTFLLYVLLTHDLFQHILNLTRICMFCKSEMNTHPEVDQ